MRKIAFFAIAGGTGFLVDAIVLSLLLRFTPLDPFTVRLGAIAVAMGCTYAINRSFTFGPSGRTIAAEGTRYGGVGLTSAALNYLIYSGALLIAPSLPPLAALTIASALATLFSYFGYSRFVFGR
jgi:Predicted membrane protein